MQLANDSGESKHAKVAWDEAKLTCFYTADVFRKLLHTLDFNDDDLEPATKKSNDIEDPEAA